MVTCREVLEQAIGIDGFIDYHDMYEYWRGADLAINGIEELLDTGHAAAVVELSEYALRCLEGAMNNAIHRNEIQDDWYRFRDESIKDIAIDFLESEGVAWQDDMGG